MIAALILAAGQSRRMGRPKMPLPWGDSTVLGRVIRVFKAAEIATVMVVTGGDREEVVAIAEQQGASTVFNAEYERQEMLSSLQVGLEAFGLDVGAALVALGDQPQIQESTVRLIVDEYRRSASPLIVPSYKMRRGHPWLMARELWPSMLRLSAPQTPRDFLNGMSGKIRYVEVDTPTILQDLDTPDEYLKSLS